MNNHSDVVGYSAIKSRRGSVVLRAFIWHHSHMLDLGVLGGSSSAARAINDHGDVVGWSNSAVYPDTHAFRYSKGRMDDLTARNHGYNSASGINDTGEIVGQTASIGSSFTPTCWFHNNLQYLGGGFQGEANAVNDAGFIAGAICQHDLGSSNACVWQRGQLKILKVPSDALSSAATAINNCGVVVGAFKLPSGSVPCKWNLSDAARHAFL